MPLRRAQTGPGPDARREAINFCGDPSGGDHLFRTTRADGVFYGSGQLCWLTGTDGQPLRVNASLLLYLTA